MDEKCSQEVRATVSFFVLSVPILAKHANIQGQWRHVTLKPFATKRNVATKTKQVTVKQAHKCNR